MARAEKKERHKWQWDKDVHEHGVFEEWTAESFVRVSGRGSDAQQMQIVGPMNAFLYQPSGGLQTFLDFVGPARLGCDNPDWTNFLASGTFQVDRAEWLFATRVTWASQCDDFNVELAHRAWQAVESATRGRVKRPSPSKTLGPSKFVLAPEHGAASTRPVLVSYDEWRPRQHIRVATFSDGRYQIEVNGAWIRGRKRRTENQNGFFNGSKHGAPVYRGYLKSIAAQGGKRLPSCSQLEGASNCVLRTEATAMNADVSGYRASWISEKCDGYPSAMADAAWDLVERVTLGEIRRDWGICKTLTDCPLPRTQ